MEFAGDIDQKRGDGTGGVVVCRGEEGTEVFGCQDGVVVDHEQMGEVGKLFESQLAGGGESAPEAEVLAGRNHFAREGGIFTGLCGGGVGAIVANHHGVRWKGLAVEGVEQAGEEIGAEAGGDQGDNFRRGRHRFRMYGLR